MGVITGHPVLNANSRQMALALSEAGILDEFHTTLDTTVLARLFPHGRVGRSIGRRKLPGSVHRRTRTHPVPEVIRLIRRSIPALTNTQKFAPDTVLHAIDWHMSRAIHQQTRAVYAYEDGALASFSRAREMGITRLYDLPIGYWRSAEKLLMEEVQQVPEWASTISMSTVADHAERMERKDAEISLASAIVVASQFTARTLETFPGEIPPVRVIPYGGPPVAPERTDFTNRILRVLYVGSLTQRKGLSYLFDAVSEFDQHVELTVVGRKVAPNKAVDLALAKRNVTWVPTVDHSSLLNLMRSHDLLAFPSLFEGFGLVLPEALSQGLPVLATSHTGAPDIITDGLEGWVVPVRSADAIRARIELLLEHPALRRDMSHAATITARSLSWAAYRERLSAWVSEALVE